MDYRNDPAHGVHEFPDTPTIVFITACTANRKPWLANKRVHAALKLVWSDTMAWGVGRYVIMPDHVHFFASPFGMTTLETWMRYWKAQLTRHLKISAGQWQIGHWDTRMRTVQQYEEKWDYVTMNPVRHGLVEDSEAWPYRGELLKLHWE